MSNALNNDTLRMAFAHLSTPLIADAALRLGYDLRMLPPGLRSLASSSRFAGRALPIRHVGSVDIFLEALTDAVPGDIAVIDNDARLDEACIGDLTVLEMQGAGIAGIVLWGHHRDTAELVTIGLPIFSLGSCPAGPKQLRERPNDALECAWLGDLAVRRSDIVFADDDGAIVVRDAEVSEVLTVAERIGETERTQAAAMRAGKSLRTQLEFAAYLARQAEDSSYTFRAHLRRVGGAIEE